MRDSAATLGSRPAIMHALRSVLRVCSVSEAPGATVTTTTVRALLTATGGTGLGLERTSRLGAVAVMRVLQAGREQARMTGAAAAAWRLLVQKLPGQAVHARRFTT